MSLKIRATIWQNTSESQAFGLRPAAFGLRPAVPLVVKTAPVGRQNRASGTPEPRLWNAETPPLRRHSLVDELIASLG